MSRQGYGTGDARVARVCEYCDKPFTVRKADAKRGYGRYCSVPCANRGKVGRGKSKPTADQHLVLMTRYDKAQFYPRESWWLQADRFYERAHQEAPRMAMIRKSPMPSALEDL